MRRPPVSISQGAQEKAVMLRVQGWEGRLYLPWIKWLCWRDFQVVFHCATNSSFHLEAYESAVCPQMSGVLG